MEKNIYCDICDKYISKHNFSRHKKTKKHLYCDTNFSELYNILNKIKELKGDFKKNILKPYKDKNGIIYYISEKQANITNDLFKDNYFNEVNQNTFLMDLQ